MKRTGFLVVVALLVLVALLQAGPAEATEPLVRVKLKSIDCDQICFGVVNLSDTDVTTTLTLYVDGVQVWQMENFLVKAGFTEIECRTWAADGDDLTFDLGYDMHLVRVEATDIGYLEGYIGPCAEPPGCETELIAGQDWDDPAGTVYVWDDGMYLHVQYVTTSSWTLGETHLYVGTTPPERAAPGQFPYSDGDHYMIPLSDLDLSGNECGPLYIAAHGVVTGMGGAQETVWADSYGVRIRSRGPWGLYFAYDLCANACLQPPNG
jgi:hypothetical protein